MLGSNHGLRVGDLDAVAGTLTIRRSVVELRPRYTRDGECGFRVKKYPKNQHWRKVAIGEDLGARLVVHCAGRPSDALMFPAAGRVTDAAAEDRAVPRSAAAADSDRRYSDAGRWQRAQDVS